MVSKRKIEEFVMGFFELDFIEPFIFDDVSWKEAIIGMVPVVGTLVHLLGGNSSEDPELDDPYFDSTKSSDTSRRVGDAPRNEDGFSLGTVWSFLRKLLIFGVVAGAGIFLITGVASGLGFVEDNPVTEYAAFAADETGDAAAGEVDSAESVSREARGPIEMITCVFEGPGCLRQKQAEEKPGSEDVGEKYGLKIENFRVGSGDGLDVSYQDPGTSIPVSFRVSNPMNGRKGIHARDVMYRIKVIDGDRGVDNPYCDTGWLHIGTADVDNDGDQNHGPGGNGVDDIRRGTTAGTGFVDLNREYMFGSEDSKDANRSDGRMAVNAKEYEIRHSGNQPLTYKSCEMLQPALGESRKIFLRLRYDYYSGGQVKFQAMSRSYMLDEEIKQEIQPSKAPDTPVQAAVNVKSPVTFTERGGSREPVPFGIDVFTETSDSGLRYRIQGLEVINSRFTSGMDSSCSFKNTAPGERMRLKDGSGPNEENIKQRVIYQQGIENVDYWYSKGNRPSLIGCRMYLGDKDNSGELLNQISRSGETLAYRVRSNYTVSLKEPLDNFEVAATSACNQMECPRLVTLSKDAGSSYDYKTACDGVDAYGGCSIVDGRWGEFDMKVLNEGIDSVIEEGEVAVDIGKFDADGAVGFEKDKWKKLDDDLNGERDSSPEWKNYSIVSFETDEEEKEIELLQLSKENCKNQNYAPGYSGANKIYWKCGKKTSESKSGSSDSGDNNGGSDSSGDQTSSSDSNYSSSCSDYSTETACSYEPSCDWESGDGSQGECRPA